MRIGRNIWGYVLFVLAVVFFVILFWLFDYQVAAKHAHDMGKDVGALVIFASAFGWMFCIASIIVAIVSIILLSGCVKKVPLPRRIVNIIFLVLLGIIIHLNILMVCFSVVLTYS